MTSSIVLYFSSLKVIISEFYDLDVGTVKKIEIKPKRVQDSFFGSGTWILKEVQRFFFFFIKAIYTTYSPNSTSIYLLIILHYLYMHYFKIRY